MMMVRLKPNVGNFGFPRPPNCLSRNEMLSLQLSKTSFFAQKKNIHRQTKVEEEAGQQRSNLPNCEAATAGSYPPKMTCHPT